MDNSCIYGCDGGLLSLPIYAAGDDTTAREDVYYLGIVDVLQEYTPTKRLENFAKGLWSNRQQISVVPPKEFAERLYKVMENITV
ncbi:putative phosphatidylinositol-4-phosphate 5-kinase-like [Trypanosoma grayi]|uniref:putative phosphatidylinositol-4-phosphate 5-kinase-like n=1 Tax=Trypanosoma grayi TaxID=71804 RepID=UPI0004F4477A|nr:putative phosphatidylinositol-4-phosphate 5-kinase-like [Trypanosoma grayi]KEG09309.1 putative phosphatidylinositol-4-phosphate 5-kinase-like [Trypanosoma grayi]